MANQRPSTACAQRNRPPLPGPLPSTLDSSGQSGRDEEISSQGTGTKNKSGRANWNHQRIVYLIGVLKDHDVPRYRTNNAWSKEAWKSITAQFNTNFSTEFTVSQVKQKEQDMKKEYRVVKDLSAESGFGWDSDRMMVTAPDDVWKTLDSRRNKESLLRWRDKSFPYYDDLFALYDGRYAEGRSCRGMDHYANREKQSVGVAGASTPSFEVPNVQFHSPAPSIRAPCASSLNFEFEEGGSRDETNWFGADAFSQFSDQVNNSTFLESLEGPQELHPADLTSSLDHCPETPCMNSRPSSSTPQVPDKRRAKKQKNQQY
jgi:hypothetical protein